MAATRERGQPRISVNKLGEYLIATPARRKRILLDQKRPDAFKVARYVDAQRAIVEFFVRGQDDGVLFRELERLRDATPASDFEASNNELCAEAIESFIEKIENLDLDGVVAIAGENDAPKLIISDVEVSVRPEVVLRARSNHRPVGVLKLHFSKSFGHDDRSGVYVATLLHWFAQNEFGEDVEREHCRVIDIFGGATYEAPRAFTRRRVDVEAACEEIASRWGSL